MALESLSFALQFQSKGTSQLDDSYLADQLGITPNYHLEVYRRTSREDTVVTIFFPSVSMVEKDSTDNSSDDKYERFDNDVAALQLRITEWISGSADAVSKLLSLGVQIRLIGNLWMHSDQFDLVLIPELTKSCGLNGIEIYLLSNE